MAITLNDNIYSASPKALDAKYLRFDNTPYTSITEVNTTIPQAFRSIGLTVLVNTEEYWYRNGIFDTDLILKSSTGGGLKQIFVINGNGVNDIFTITHTLNTEDISNPVIRSVLTGEIQYTGNTVLSVTQFTVDFGYIPAIGEDFIVIVFA